MPLNTENTKLILSHWIPMGINNLVALNRHLGTHKTYTSPTCFGMKGSVKDLQQGTAKMESEGVLLKPIGLNFSNALKAELSSKKNSAKTKGLELHKNGACFIGAAFEDSISITQLKKTLGEVESEFASEFIPILTENQQSLLEAIYGLEENETLKNSLSAYGLVITESIG